MGATCGCRRRDSVYPLSENSIAPLTARQVDAVCCRSGLTQAEVLRLHQRYACLAAAQDGEDIEAMQPSQVAQTLLVSKLLDGLPQLHKMPLRSRLPAALHLPMPSAAFSAVATSLGMLGERAPAEDKAKFFYTLYDYDADGRLSHSDLEAVLRELCPGLEDEIVKHAARKTLAEVGGDGAQTLSLEEFTVAIGDIVAERGTAFF